MKDWDPRYDELLYRPRPLSAEHPAVPLRERAAQFAAFQALNGLSWTKAARRFWTPACAVWSEADVMPSPSGSGRTGKRRAAALSAAAVP